MILGRWLVTCLAAVVCCESPAQDASLRESAVRINATIRANHYRPSELDSEAYRSLEDEVLKLSEKAASREEFIAGFNSIWRRGPFSHVALRKADEPAANSIARLDTMIAGKDAVSLTWHQSTAILTVNTMNGVDTIRAIEAAYDEIALRKPEKLIVDLRRNGGGAFAVVPLVGHLIDKPMDVGVFVVGSWYVDHPLPPGVHEFATAVPWRGYSVQAFQSDVLSRPLTGYRVDALEPRYAGPVIVLIGGRSISAAEIAADALKASGRATIIGEKTPGMVLSSKSFDIPGALHLRVPIADYYSITGSRLDGVGVTPDVVVKADAALDTALSR